MRREVRATLAARRELGPEYDDYFVEALVQRLAYHLIPRRKGGRVAAEPRIEQLRDPLVASANQRLFLAVLSLGALIFLALALAASAWGLAGFLLGSGVIGVINVMFAKSR
jgi:hypothetical protein